MMRSTQMVTASVLTALAIALFWLGAPIVPAVVGVCAGGVVLWWSNRVPLETPILGRLAEARAPGRPPLRTPH
jgi:hypothetical protein